eukprot:3537399-Karenia_brevis.AAC.1
MQVAFAGGGATEITVDSGAEESASPWEWGKHLGTRRIEETRLRNASAVAIPHYLNLLRGRAESV